MNKKQENKKENRKSRGLFIVIMIACLLVGGVVGFVSVSLSEGGKTAFVESISWFLRWVLPWGTPLSLVLLLAVYFPLYAGARKLFAAWDQEDEAVIEKAEHKLEIVLLWQNILQILSFFCFGCCAAYIKNAETKMDWITILVSTLCMFAFLIAMTLTQRRVVDLVKEMNPEKHGSVYDVNFNKKWLESSDEAEKLMIYKSAFQAYKVTTLSCSILWMIVVICSLTFTMDLTALACVTLIWLINTVTYSVYAMKLSKNAGLGSII